MDMDKRKLGDNELEMVSGGTDESEDITIGERPVICDNCNIVMLLHLEAHARYTYSCPLCGAEKVIETK